jgi:DNA-binding transcriptional ArsR family regulator
MLLNSILEVSGLGEWIVRTAEALPPEIARMNRLVFQGLYFALLPDSHWPDFPAYIADLAARDPQALRDRLLSAITQRGGDQPGEWAHLLASVNNYITYLRERFPGAIVDDDIETEVHRLLNHPDEMQHVIVAHLQYLWERCLAPEWRANEPLLRQAVTALERVPLQGLSAMDAVYAITGQRLLGEREKILGNASEIIFVPSAHKGPYLDTFIHGDVMWLIFGARLPDCETDHASALHRSDLLVRLSALTDDTRLSMLALLSRHDELCSPDIMAQLHLTQSATSRHLRQLSAAGYVVERRREGAKCYSLNRVRIADTFRALDRFLGAS